ncbi:uncharacterized protein LOC123690974 [Colias croceus]|uniref:uncharacterized protein LOC123690974 n=1 Tax=Colias crocea TaxID=72248 RepID=UPI001E27BE53|nr:uncharacterized protein LOC123690974 [Colias croceus]
MSGIQWSQEQTMLFLETLQAEPFIWDPSEKSHKDKKKVNDAWVRIRDVFEIPVEELKKKKDSLFATYRGYYRKIEASLKSGAGADDVYRPVWFAFEFMNSFLGCVYKCKQTITTDHGTDSIEEETTNASEDVPIASPTPKEPEPRKNKHTIRRRDNPPELQVASRQMTEAFNNLNKVINNPSKDDDDECDVFGKLIAKKLKRLPEHERDNIMFDIHALFRKSPNKRSPSGESFCTSKKICITRDQIIEPRYIPKTQTQSYCPEDNTHQSDLIYKALYQCIK